MCRFSRQENEWNGRNKPKVHPDKESSQSMEKGIISTNYSDIVN